MKKSLIGTLALGLIIGSGVLTVNSFADEKVPQGDAEFKVLNQETSQFEKLDDNQYRNNNYNYGQCCSQMNFNNYGNENIQ